MPKPPFEAHFTNLDNSLFSPLAARHVPREHPRLLGSRARLQALAKERPDAWRRTKAISQRPLAEAAPGPDGAIDRGTQIGIASKLTSMALVCAIEDDPAVGRAAVELAFQHILDRPVPVGHVTFGGDVGWCAIVYDLCHEHWTEAERTRFHDFLFACRDRNVDEEITPFHDGWWGYKNWGFVLGLLAVMYETEKELFMLYLLDREFRTIAADALRLAGDGGGYPEGFYVNYYMWVWLMACEAMRHCTGADYVGFVPEFYRGRALASIFETYPTIRERGSRRSIGVGDASGRVFRVERDGALTANQMLVAYHRDDPLHQALASFLDRTPHVGADENAFLEFLFFDPTVPRRPLSGLPLAHVSPGPGFVYARSSWEEDATYFFFKCGKRFTSHQHLDVGHFYIFKHEELATEGGHYSDFGGAHDVNYYLRTIAHNSVLVHDPAEEFHYIRAHTGPIVNDGGQRYPWPGTCFRQNGEAMDADAWRRHPELGDLADLLAFADLGSFVYTAGDCTRAYSSRKLAWFTRQIVFLRPGTFVVFDRVKATDPTFKKTWLLHAAKPPTGAAPHLVVTNGRGRLHLQTVLPTAVEVVLNQADDLYRHHGGHFPPRFKGGAEAECRIEVSPAIPAQADVFLHVLTATDASIETVPRGVAAVAEDRITLTLGEVRMEFLTASVGGSIESKGRMYPLRSSLAR